MKAITEIADFNEKLGGELSDEDYDTVGGLVLHTFGRLPKRGESATIDDFKFTVLRADSRRLYSLLAEKKDAGIEE